MRCPIRIRWIPGRYHGDGDARTGRDPRQGPNSATPGDLIDPTRHETGKSALRGRPYRPCNMFISVPDLPNVTATTRKKRVVRTPVQNGVRRTGREVVRDTSQSRTCTNGVISVSTLASHICMLYLHIKVVGGVDHLIGSRPGLSARQARVQLPKLLLLYTFFAMVSPS